MSKILEGLYLGDIETANNKEFLVSANIKKVVSAVSDKIPIYTKDQGIEQLRVIVDDDYDVNISKHFAEVCNYINDAINSKQSVLVHCTMGVSRSASLTIAYVMWKYKLSASKGLKKVREARSCVKPNSGFMSQLDSWEELISLALDDSDEETSITEAINANFRLQRVMDERAEYGEVRYDKLKELLNESDKDKKEDINDEIKTENENIGPIIIAGSSKSRQLLVRPGKKSSERGVQLVKFYCRKCRLELFTQQNTIPHKPATSGNKNGFSKSGVKSKKVEGRSAGFKPKCQNTFIEPLVWMKDIDGSEGKLSCPKCSAALGKFSWYGTQCSCSKWITPAFSIPNSKLDISVVTQNITTTTTATTTTTTTTDN